VLLNLDRSLEILGIEVQMFTPVRFNAGCPMISSAPGLGQKSQPSMFVGGIGLTECIVLREWVSSGGAQGTARDCEEVSLMLSIWMGAGFPGARLLPETHAKENGFRGASRVASACRVLQTPAVLFRQTLVFSHFSREMPLHSFLISHGDHDVIVIRPTITFSDIFRNNQTPLGMTHLADDASRNCKTMNNRHHPDIILSSNLNQKPATLVFSMSVPQQRTKSSLWHH
jgi:hypothetical protein